MRWVTSWLLLLAIAAAGRSARADLAEDVATLEKAWNEAYTVSRLTPRLLERGDLNPVLLTRSATDPSAGGCTTVVVLGPPSANFILRFLPTSQGPRWPNGEWPEASIAGAAQLVRCGARKQMLSRLVVEMRSPRAVLETLVVEGAVPASSLRGVLPHRDPGPMAPLQSSGPRPELPPLRDRARQVERRAQREGAAALDRDLLRADGDGTGVTLLRLAAGCHRLDLLATGSSADPRVGVDVDLELSWVVGGEVAAVDRAESPDATAMVCTGGKQIARLRFAGAPPRSTVLLVHARWDLPPGLPERWGPTPRAKIAEAMRSHHGRAPGSSPIHESMGVSGVTVLPLEVEPGACYLTALAPIRGRSTGLAVAATVGVQAFANRGDAEGGGTVLAFCAGSNERALVEVEARGVGLVWVSAVWQTGRMALENVE